MWGPPHAGAPVRFTGCTGDSYDPASAALTNSRTVTTNKVLILHKTDSCDFLKRLKKFSIICKGYIFSDGLKEGGPVQEE